MTTTAELIERLKNRNFAKSPTLARAYMFEAATRLAEQEAVIAKRDAEIARLTLGENFQAVRKVEAETGHGQALKRAEAAESELSRVSARLAEAEAHIDAVTRHDTIPNQCAALRAARAFLNPDTEVTKP